MEKMTVQTANSLSIPADRLAIEPAQIVVRVASGFLAPVAEPKKDLGHAIREVERNAGFVGELDKHLRDRLRQTMKTAG